jgi:DNA topoisomerase VI subunit A
LEKSAELGELDPWSLYIYAMKAPMTRDRYQTRLAKFLAFIGIAGNTVQERSRAFAKRGKDDSIWALNSVLKFVQFQKDRVDKKEISGATVRNYVKSIKLFCEMADMPIPWKKNNSWTSKGKEIC